MTIPEDIKIAADGISVGTLVATLAGWLPQIASLLTCVWVLIRIYESKTVQGIITRLRK